MTVTERKALVKSYLGKTITIKIDRPIGYIHKKENYSLTYPINYGYIPGVLGGDGEELDVYLLGVDVPVSDYTGKIIGIVYRKNDVEDKLIMAPEGVVFTQNEIEEQIYFQEQYYETEIEALFQKSCGAVIFRKTSEGFEYLCLFQRRSQTYSVPKGHMEAFETEKETAQREIREEIGISVDFVQGFRETVQYKLADGKLKTVVLFLTECRENITTDEKEIEKYQWLSAFTFSNYNQPGERNTFWYVDGVKKYHRTFSNIISALCRTGFVIDTVCEPLPIENATDFIPNISEKEFIKPTFLIVKARK